MKESGTQDERKWNPRWKKVELKMNVFCIWFPVGLKITN